MKAIVVYVILMMLGLLSTPFNLNASCDHKEGRNPNYSINYCHFGWRVYEALVLSYDDGGCSPASGCCKNCVEVPKSKPNKVYTDYDTDGPHCNMSNWEQDRIMVGTGTYTLFYTLYDETDCDPASNPGCGPGD